ncbi:MAG: efflux RND transporter permease subunit [Planctomycetota bacterium]
MLSKLIHLSLRHRWVVIIVFAVASVGGAMALKTLPLDAFPDTTPVQVQVNTMAAALSPLEIEQQVTLPIERALAGLPALRELRSLSKFGFSQLTLVFEDGTDLYLARQLTSERLQNVELPEGLPRPALGSVATGLGEIFHYVIEGPSLRLSELTSLHESVVKPQILSVPGVAEVNTWGGEHLEFQVRAKPDLLASYGLTLEDVVAALHSHNLSVGAGYLERGGERTIVQAQSLPSSTKDLGAVVLTSHEGVAVRVRDVAEVTEGAELRHGAVTANGEGEKVLGLAYMLTGENSLVVSRRLEQRLKDIAPSLPEGVTLRPLYERSELVLNVMNTVEHSLMEGALLVVAVLLLFLGHLRCGLMVAAVIPLSMLGAGSLMQVMGIAGSLMSLGAIDFGLIVDSSVIMVENVMHRLSEHDRGADARKIVADAAIEVRKPTLFGELIIMIVFLPVLTLQGIEGRLFRPMALTLISALAVSLVMSVTLMPALTSFLRPGRQAKPTRVMQLLSRLYNPVLGAACRHPGRILVMALSLLGLGSIGAMRLGHEFVPRLSEMGIVINAVRLASISLPESIRTTTDLEKRLLELYPDEIRDVWSRTGTAEVANDPMGVELSDVFIMLRPMDQWKRAKSQAELTDLMRRELEPFPGMRKVYTQPIELRMNEMVTGVRADLAVKLFGDDLALLEEKAHLASEILVDIQGAADVVAESQTRQPVLQVNVDLDAASRFGISPASILAYAGANAGLPAGEVRRGTLRHPVTVRLPYEFSRDSQAFSRLVITTPQGERLPLSELTTLTETEGPSSIKHEWQKRTVNVQCNIRRRDIGSFVEEAREQLTEKLGLPPGMHFTLGGQFEHMERARARLQLVVPMALALVLLLLHASTGSLGDTLSIFTAAPFAALGGVAALHARGMDFTISAGVGFVAVSGVAMLNGLVLVSAIRNRFRSGASPTEAVMESARSRLRPVMMTAMVATLGFLPMALSTGVGAEVQRPLATVVIGGLAVSTLLTLVVLPPLMLRRFRRA